MELPNGGAHTSVSNETTNCSDLKLQRFNQIEREREAYFERVKLLERELEQCKLELASLKSSSNVACEGRSALNESIEANNEAGCKNASTDTPHARITGAKILAEKEIANDNVDGNCEKNVSMTDSNKENREVARSSEAIPDHKEVGTGIEKICNSSAEMITSLSHKLSETIHERDELKRVVHELRCQNDDYRTVYGSLDDLTDLRQQYESLFQEEYDFVNNIAYADVMSGSGRHRSQQNRRDLDRICHDLNQFVAGIKIKYSSC